MDWDSASAEAVGGGVGAVGLAALAPGGMGAVGGLAAVAPERLHKQQPHSVPTEAAPSSTPATNTLIANRQSASPGCTSE